MVAIYRAPDVAFLRVRRRVPRSSSGLSTAEIMPVATRVYRAVVSSLWWPSSAWMTRMPTPRSNRWVAKLWRSGG